jgi:hypothetical protein
VVLALSPEAADLLSKQPAALGFVQDAYSRLKVIGHSAGSEGLIKKAGVRPDDGVVLVNTSAAAAPFHCASSDGSNMDPRGQSKAFFIARPLSR